MNGRQAADVEEPLLLSNSSVAQEEDGDQQKAAADADASIVPAAADVDPASVRLLSHLALLLRAARAWQGAVCLALLSVIESYVISRSGTVAGSFYKVLVDAAGADSGGDAGTTADAKAALGRVFFAAACWYGSAALLASAKSALSDGLAWAWRARLAKEMQRLYLKGAAHYRLARPSSSGGEEGGGGANANGGTTAAKRRNAPPPIYLDSPDQRVAQDLPSLTRALADASSVLVAAPFGVCWYALLVRRAFAGAWWPVVAAASFFALGALAQRLLVRRVARLVFALEAAEGSYRFAHARLRGAEAEGVALYSSCSEATATAAEGEGEEEEERREQQQRERGRRGQRQRRHHQAAPAELAALDARLSAVLRAEGRLIPARWALAAATRLIDYSGALLNYACVAAAVFGVAGAAFSGGSGGGGGGGSGGSDESGASFSSSPGDGGGGPSSSSSSSSSPGDVAQRVSVASFYLLTLIYSFTQVLDLSRTLSDAAGLAARVGGLLEALRRQEAAAGDDGAASAASGSNGKDAGTANQPLLELRGVRLSTAGRRSGGGALVVSGLSLAVSAPGSPPTSRSKPISSLLIVGPSGVGKTTLVRAVAGLAPLDGGQVFASDGGVFFVPQRPLAAPGATLRLQLTYPHGPCACSLRAEKGREQNKKRGRTLALAALGLGWCAEGEQQQRQRRQKKTRGQQGLAEVVSSSSASECPVCGGDARLLTLLEEVGLAHLPSRLGLSSLDAPLRLRGAVAQASSSAAATHPRPPPVVAPDWASVLSPGELQRLAFARLLRANPHLAVLDEPVASLPASAARSLYTSLTRRGIAYVSCGHEGGGLERVHEATLRILGDGNGGWTLDRN